MESPQVFFRSGRTRLTSVRPDRLASSVQGTETNDRFRG